MLKSMTAYGRSSVSTHQGKFNIEIQSVNKRHFELQCYLPSYLQRFEAKIRSLIAEHIYRGQIIVRITLSAEGEQAPPIYVNKSLLKQYMQAWQSVAKELGYGADYKLPLTLFNGQPGLLGPEELKDEESFWDKLKTALLQALASFKEGKLIEGKKLQADLLDRCKRLQGWGGEVEAKAGNATTKYREKLKERLEEVLPGAVDNDERILREVCIYADKVDITEEIVRLRAHLEKLQQLLTADMPYVGKEIEFLLQEITREINTTGSKSGDLELTQLTLAMKNEVERIKEQVQNIE